MDIKAQLKKLIENICQNKLRRRVWRHILVIVNLIQLIYQNLSITQGEYNNNNMDQDLAELVPDAPDGNNAVQEQHEHGEQQQVADNMDISDVEDDDDDVDDDDSDQDFDELYSSAGEDDGEWTSSNESDDASSVRIGSIQPQKQSSVDQPLEKENRIYLFQPLKLIRCQFKPKNKPGEFPLARSGHRIIASNSHLYSLGGYNPRSALSAARNGQCLLFQELWSYNFASNLWKLEINSEMAKDMPAELASNALAIHNNVLISHGGTGYPFGESCSNDCFVYTTGSQSTVTRLKVTGDLPIAQYGPGIVIHKHYLYTVGGTTGFDYSCDVFRLNMITRVWENVYICRPEMREDPEGRYRHEVVYDGKHIFVLGGGTSHSVYDLQRIPAYNLDANSWDYFETIPDRTMISQDDAGYPKPRKCFSCVQHTLYNGDIEAFVTGGLQGDLTTYFSDIWKLNLRTKQWTRIVTATLPKPLYFHSAAHSDNGCMYVFGGIEYSEKDMRRRNDLYKMWMTIPKLSEMCWDAITYYNENLETYDRSSLRKMGIPISFVERLPEHRMRKSHPQLDQASVSLCSLAKRARAQFD